METTISKIANFAKIINSRLVARIRDEITPNCLETIFLPIKYVKNAQSVPYKATGNLAVNSFIAPKIPNDKHSPQKYRGGF